MTTTTHDAADRVDISYRQLDHWIRCGYLHAEARGSGNPRTLTAHEFKVLTYMALLVHAGVHPHPADTHARRLARGRTTHLGPWKLEPLP